MDTNAMRGLRAAGLVLTAVVTMSSPLPADARSSTGWTACPGGEAPLDMQCTTLEVPVDWSRPYGPVITLDVARLPAADPRRRVGSVLTFPGGPGQSGIDVFRQSPGSFAGLRERFDVIAMNPRNNGARRALPESCNRPALTAISDPPNREAYRSQAAVLAEAVARCRADDASGLVEHLDSVSVARDAAAVREMLGEDEVSLLAWSYGGVPAVAYARLHPGRIRAVVFDDTIDQTAGPSGVDDVLMPSIEENFPRFAAWCADDDSCALHGQDVRRTWHALIERTTRRPVTYTSPGLGTIRLSDLHLRFFGGAGMPSSSAWPSLAGAIADAAGGDFSWFGEQALRNSAAWTAPGFLAMRCPDGLGYHGYDAFVAGREHAERISPGFGGGATGWESLACAGWRRAAANPPRPLPAGGFPPALGIGGYSNYATTAALVRKIPGSVSVPYEGSGHVMYLSGNRCMTGHADRYLAELRLPRAGTVCGPAG